MLQHFPFAALLRIVFLFLLPLVINAAQLEWDQTEVRIELKPNQKEARAKYVVTNRGDDTVRIAEVKTSCGCTGSILDYKIIKPGQSTTVIAIFNKGKRTGLNHNTLKVYLDNQTDAVATLHMIVQVPTLVEAKPNIVYWNSSTPNTERQVRITLDKRYINEISRIEYDRAMLTIIEESDPNGDFDRILRVMPKSFDDQIRESVRIKAHGKNGTTAEARLHIFVQP